MRLWGRPVKPFALAIAVTMLIIAWLNLIDRGVFGGLVLGDAVGLVAFASAVTLVAGWAARQQKMAEAGLLMAAGVWVARGTLALIEAPGSLWMFSFCWAGAAAGAYLLETADKPRGPRAS